MDCPVCGEELKVFTEVYDTPHFGDVFISSVSCKCGFKHSDCFVVSINEPVRYKIEVNSKNYFTRVVRSSSGTIRIPELGVDMEPGPASQGFITNLEGVLYRIEEIVRTARNWNKDDEEKVRRCDKILERIHNTLNGEDRLTLIIEDPLGNSFIDSEEAVKEVLTEEEASKLKRGIYIIDSSNFEKV